VQERVDDVAAVRSVVSVVTDGGSARDQYRRLYRWMAATDVLAFVAALGLAYLLAYFFRFDNLVPTDDGPRVDRLIGFVVAPVVLLVVFVGFRLYEAHRFAPAEEFRRIIIAVSLGVGVLMVTSFWSKAELSRMWVAVSWGLALAFVLASRRLWHARIYRQRMRGKLTFPTIIVGTNAEAQRLATTLSGPTLGFRPVGMITTHDRSGGTPDLPVLGGVGDLREILRETGADCVFVASTAVTPEELKPVARVVRIEGLEVRITASLPEVLSSRLTVQPLGGTTALSLRPARLTGTQVVAKFTFDILLSGLLLLLLSPFLAIVAIAIKASSPGPVLFRQRRIGLRGRPFTMLKFRTMRNGAEREVERLRSEWGVTDVMFKLKNDPRITPVGRLLRRLSLDELPQLFNVVKGDMSLVGPRPPLPEEVTRYEDWHFERLEVLPGLTGLWQVSGRSDLSFDECVRLDLFYVENWSLAYDLYILAKTIPVLFSKRGAY
jgi:exopolysaccharide biosynthesis polyprenyl glycosylphosphotransferase